jgi:transposase
MAAPIPLRPDFDAPRLRALARRSRDPDQTRRLVALAAIYEGASRSEAARIGCVTLQIVRDWVLRFNARGPQGLVTGRAPGSRPLLNETQRQELQRMVDHGPIPSVHGVVRWRLVDLVQWVFEEFRITISKQTLSRELRALSYRKLSARPRHHARSEAAVSAFKIYGPAAPRKRAVADGEDGSHQSIRPVWGAPAPGHHGNPRAPGLLRLQASRDHF